MTEVEITGPTGGVVDEAKVVAEVAGEGTEGAGVVGISEVDGATGTDSIDEVGDSNER